MHSGARFLILFAVVFLVDHSTIADDGYISEIWPALYGMIQFVPLMILEFTEFTEFSQFKLMRRANKATTRTAPLCPRRLFEFVSPTLVDVTIVLYATAVFFDLYVHDFVFDWGHDTLVRTAVFVVTNLFLVGFGAWNLYGGKQNPHQSLDDQNRQIATNLSSLFYVSIAMSVFIFTQIAADVIDMNFLDATLMSIYFQAIAFLSLGHAFRNFRLEDVDLGVYKNDAEAT